MEKQIRFACGQTSLGMVLAAAGGKGLAAVLMGDNQGGLHRALVRVFPEADLVEDAAALAPTLTKVIAAEAGQEFATASQRRLLAPPGVGFRAPKRSDRLGREHRSAENTRRMTAVVEFLPSLAVNTPTAHYDLPLDMHGSDVELAVWEALRLIPPGESRSYGQIAKTLPVAATAQEVGAACAANVLAIVIPCHRVVKADGSISGYRWGVSRKRQLLERERAA